MKKLRNSNVDMSAAAIDHRLRKLSQLRRFGKSLEKGRWVGERRVVSETPQAGDNRRNGDDCE